MKRENPLISQTEGYNKDRVIHYIVEGDIVFIRFESNSTHAYDSFLHYAIYIAVIKHNVIQWCYI